MTGVALRSRTRLWGRKARGIRVDQDKKLNTSENGKRVDSRIVYVLDPLVPPFSESHQCNDLAESLFIGEPSTTFTVEAPPNHLPLQ